MTRRTSPNVRRQMSNPVFARATLTLPPISATTRPGLRPLKPAAQKEANETPAAQKMAAHREDYQG